MVKNIFIKAFLISVGIFVIGFFIGSTVERTLTSYLQTKTQAVENSIQEIELESLYLLSVSNSSCVFLNDLVRRTNNNLDDLASQLASYDEDKIIFTNKDLVNIKSKYTNLLVKDWLLQESIKQRCGTNSVSVLYFYERQCRDCILQGDILTVLKQEFREKVMVFPLDNSLDISTVNLLKMNYNITQYPSVVVNNVPYTGIVPFSVLKDSVCSVISQDEKCKNE